MKTTPCYGVCKWQALAKLVTNYDVVDVVLGDIHTIGS